MGQGLEHGLGQGLEHGLLQHGSQQRKSQAAQHSVFFVFKTSNIISLIELHSVNNHLEVSISLTKSSVEISCLILKNLHNKTKIFQNFHTGKQLTLK